MSKPDQAREPSMSDILASIRKIISDDPAAPVGTNPILATPAVPPAPREMTPRATPAPAPIVSPTAAAPAAVSVDDLLAMSGDAAPSRVAPTAPAVTSKAPAVEPGMQRAESAAPTAPSWLFPRAKSPAPEPASALPPPPTPRVEPFADAPPRVAPAPMRDEPLAPPPGPQLGPVASPTPSPGPNLASARPVPPSADLQSDLGKLIPTRMEAPGLPRLDAAPASGLAEPAARAVASTPPAPIAPESAAEPATPFAASPLPATPSSGAQNEPAPIRTPLIDRLTASARNLMSEPRNPRSAIAPDPSDTPTEIVLPPRGAVSAPAMAPEPEEARPLQAPSRPAPTETPPMAAKVAPSPLPIIPALAAPSMRAAHATPAAAVTPAKAPAASEPASQLANATPPPATRSAEPAARSMEDVVVDLMRPLIRDWLDANLPRLLEPALKAELAARDKLKGNATDA